MVGAQSPLLARPEAGPKIGPRTGPQAVAATRFLALSADAFLEVLAQEALENPALTLRLNLGEADTEARPRRAFALQNLVGPERTDGVAASQSLFEHVLRQLPLLVRDPALRPLAHVWLEGLEPSGWVSLTSSEVAARVGVSPEFAESVLLLLQDAEPDGLFARDLRECLAIQLRATDELTEDMLGLLANLPLLAAGDLTRLAEILGIGSARLSALIARLRRLNPKPGASFDNGPILTRAPDFLLTYSEGSGWALQPGRWLQATLDLTSPMVGSWAAQLRRASVLAKLTENRDRLIYGAAQQAIALQAAVLNGDRRWPVPVGLADVARPLGVHETTIGRIRDHVLIGDGHRAVNLRQFFHPAIPNATGPRLTPTELTQRIREIRARPSDNGPLSDETIRRVLVGQGIAVSRRTVTKYRRQS